MVHGKGSQLVPELVAAQEALANSQLVKWVLSLRTTGNWSSLVFARWLNPVGRDDNGEFHQNGSVKA